MSLRFEIVTIFPGFFQGFLENGIIRRAQAEGLISFGLHDLRTWTHDRHRTVDDRPFGGGEGMVLKPEPLAAALESLGVAPKPTRTSAAQPHVVLLSAQGRPFTQSIARKGSSGLGSAFSLRCSAAARRRTLRPPGRTPSRSQPRRTHARIVAAIVSRRARTSASGRSVFSFSSTSVAMESPCDLQRPSSSVAVRNG